MNPQFAPTKIGHTDWTFSRTLLVGIVNVTPDSFYDGGQHQTVDGAVAHGLALVAAGADVLDIGGESSRPGAAPVSADEEIARVVPVIAGLAAATGIPLSVDTYKAAVASAAVWAGAAIVNDISGGQMDPELVHRVAASETAHVVLGHMRGKPQTMQHGIVFDDVVGEVIAELRQAVRRAVQAGVSPSRIWVDPGIGFGKTAEQSLLLLRGLGALRDAVGYPVLVGTSRKSFIGAVTGEPVEQRLLGTCASVAVAVAAGADAVRIHDVAALKPAVQVADAIRRGIR